MLLKNIAKTICWQFSLVFFFLLMNVSTLVKADLGYTPTVLVINSYHQGFPWSDGIYSGFKKVIDGAGFPIDLHVEYLDTKRFSSKIMFPLAAALMAEKSANNFDAIVVTDNNALSFLMKYRQSHFAEIPVVFVGVNSYSKDLIGNDQFITGIAETTAPDANYQLLMSLHPDMTEVVLLSDATPTGLAEQQRFVKAAQPYVSKFSTRSITDWTLSELKLQLSALEPGTVVFRLPLHRDKEGLSMTLKESVRILLENSPVPIYSAWDTAIAEGIVGGYVATSVLQGKVAGQYLLEILNGKPVAELPVILESPAEPVFNGISAQKYAIDKKSIPEDSVILNPVKAKELSDYLIIPIVFLLVVLSGFIFQWRRKKNELSLLNDEFEHVVDETLLLRTLMNSNPDHIYAKGLDGRYLDCNQAFAEFIGQPRESVIGKRVEDFFTTENVNLSNEQDAEVFSKDKVTCKEIWVRGLSSADQLIECVKTPLKNSDDKVIGLLAVNREITSRHFENALLKQNTRVLDMLIRGVSLSNILSEIVKGIESVYSNSLCSILLLDKEKNT
ncbi:PAS domain-containing protein [Neptunomonas japonica]|uniref:PAS domain-containing protein n=1 Tax=Neptunomonas japonica JAMM 1380 TaxID=1441457 RepID=A0A7R6PE64_9GAMM|nr:PAS domain-containing protein [Neptunomonas japonica]BBB28447.1 conserved hypothetical protein [Neptunomonas japonica JAMM 1380]